MKFSNAFKSLVVTSILTMSLSASAFRSQIDPACAPEVKAVDASIQQLSSTSEFQNAEVFQAHLQRISKLSEGQKVKAYLDLADIKSDEEVASFLSSHNQEIPQKNVEALSIRAGLSKSQATLVLKTVSKSIVGERQE